MSAFNVNAKSRSTSPTPNPDVCFHASPKRVTQPSYSVHILTNQMQTASVPVGASCRVVRKLLRYTPREVQAYCRRLPNPSPTKCPAAAAGKQVEHHGRTILAAAMGDRGGFGRGFGRGGDRGDRGGDRRGGGRRRPRGRKDDEEKWIPVTKLGRLVQQV